MAIETTTVQGKVVCPDGNGATGGVIRFTLSQPGAADDGTYNDVVGGVYEATIGSDGTVSFALVPNDAITPADTYYKAEFRVTSPERAAWFEYWSMATGVDPIDIGDVTKLSNPTGVASPPTALSTGTLPTAAAAYRGQIRYVPGGAGVDDIGVQCLKTAADTYQWVQFNAGGES